MRSHIGSQAPDLGICKGGHCARAIADWALARRRAFVSCAGAAHLHIDIARLNWQCFFKVQPGESSKMRLHSIHIITSIYI